MCASSTSQVFLIGLHRDNAPIAKVLSSYECSVLVAPGEARVGGRASGLLVAGYYDILTQIAPTRPVVIAATNPFRRATLFSRVPKGWKFLTVVSESIKQKTNTAIGDGCVVHEGAVLLKSRLDQQVTIGRDCFINECVIGEFSSIHSNALVLPGVNIGRGVRVGHHATINEGVTIGNWCEVSPNATVTRNMKDGEKW
jgi:acetyltransferase-like isoleucine patch superfamily enzyme